MRIRQQLIISILFFTISQGLQAQVLGSAYSEIGATQASNGTYLKSSFLAAYNFKSSFIKTGIENSIIGYNPTFISGSKIHIGHLFHIKSTSISIEGLYLWKKPGEFIREHNFALLSKITEKKNFRFKIGTHFRSLYYKGEENSSIHENWNVLYELSYYIKKEPKRWNAGIGITNMDAFLLNQETNPHFFLKGNYLINKDISTFIEGRYKSAGSLNASVHYFGYFIRTGIKWNIKD